MTGGEKLQDHIKTLENNIQNGISEQEVIATNQATEFLNNNKNKKTEIKEKVQEKIDKSKTTITKEINTIFQTEGKFNSDKIKDLTEAQTQAYINIITWLDNKDLSDIKTALEKKQQEIKTQQEDIRLNQLLQGPYTKETATNFIENTSKEDFNKILEKIVNKKAQPVTILGSLEKGKENTENISLTDIPGEGTQEYKLLQLITAYLGENDTTKIANIQISKAKQTGVKDAFTDSRFSTNERIISYDTYTRTKKEDKDNQGITKKDANGNIIYIYTWAKETPKTPTKLVRGDDRKMEETIAEQYQIIDFTDDGNFATIHYKNDITENKKVGLNAFDDRGTFVNFDKFLKTKDTAYMSKNISTIIEALLAYTPQCVDNKPTEYKNGHAKALSDYMSTCTDTGIILTYLKYMTPNNLNLLGVDKPNRVANYNNVLFQDAKNNIMRPEVQKAINSLPLADKEKLLNDIAGVKNAITEKTSMSVGETITKGFDGLLDAFGPMLFSILKMFGIGKTTLYKRFPSAKEKIDTEFKKNYSLEKDAFDAINNIAKGYTENLNLDYGINIDKEGNILNKYPTKYPTGKDFKDTFKNNISEYITQLKTNSKNINVGVLNACVQMYNKTKNTSININDIVTIETTKIDGKEVKTITGIKNQKNNIEGEESDMFTEVMTNYLKSDTPWDNIATANKNITIPYIEDKKTTSQNEQGLDIDSAQSYLITTKKQLVKYLTASLFSNKDLEYIMTENGLETQQPKVPEVKDIVYTTNKPVNFRDGTDPNQKTLLPTGTEIKAVIDDTTKSEIKKTGKEWGMKDPKLANIAFIKVTYGGKKGYVAAEGYLTKKPDNSTTIEPENNTTNTPKENKTQPTAQVTTPTENTNTSQVVEVVPQENNSGETTTEGISQPTTIDITQDVTQDNAILETKLDENTILEFGDNFPATENKTVWQTYYKNLIMELNARLDVYKEVINNELKDKTISEQFINLTKESILYQHDLIKNIAKLSQNYIGDMTISGAIEFSKEEEIYKANIKKSYLQQAVTCNIITQQEKDEIIDKETNQALNNIVS